MMGALGRKDREKVKQPEVMTQQTKFNLEELDAFKSSGLDGRHPRGVFRQACICSLLHCKPHVEHVHPCNALQSCSTVRGFLILRNPDVEKKLVSEKSCTVHVAGAYATRLEAWQARAIPALASPTQSIFHHAKPTCRDVCWAKSSNLCHCSFPTASTHSCFWGHCLGY